MKNEKEKKRDKKKVLIEFLHWLWIVSISIAASAITAMLAIKYLHL